MRPTLIISIIVLVLLAMTGCKPQRQTATPPNAAVKPVKLEKHGDVREDNYFWLKERENPEVIAYLEAENAYTDTMMSHTEGFQEELFEEIKGRIKQTDLSVPYKRDDYYYYTRVVEGKEYPIYCRKKGSLDAAEEIMIDANALAEGHKFSSVGGVDISSGQDIVSFAQDTLGRRFYSLRFKNLSTGELLPDEIPNVTGNVAWANDNKTVFYAKQDPVTLRSYQIYRHELGTHPSADKLVYEEKDVTFSCYVFKTKSKKYVMIASNQSLSNEFRYIDADTPTGSFTVLQPRERNHEYDVDHYEDNFYIRTNLNAKNFRLMKTPVTRTTKRNWVEVIPNRDDVFLQGFEIFKDNLVVVERKEGLIQMRIRPWSGAGEHYLDFGEPAYLAYVSTNYQFDTPLLRYGYTSLTTPNSVYDYNMMTKEKTLLKQEEVLGGFNREDYVTERVSAPARDGKMVPVSIVYKKGTTNDGKNPLLLYGYGSYGASRDATFSSARLSLLNRGFIYAIAHIRGGQELGRAWYDDGKLLNKKNTFTDFIDCAEYMIKLSYTSPEHLYAQGGSAGGLLIGAVINMRHDLFKGVIADVPWVDVVTTMLDESIPLTTSEYDEWGNPNDKKYYEYMLSYSPYDNVESKAYPNILITTSLFDSQVQYFEPAKWTAKLRTMKTDNNTILLKTEMQAGHGGVSGRYKQYKDTAFKYAFLLDLEGIDD
ncbi:MAG TPA: S9 family peptidase [Bacteroidota bacterium]|nr:S9 family peptidase [Bacteroidota bacterium]